MAMLAEKKRSAKWQLNPRGTSLLEKPNFGKQILEKLGWKSGQGLGANNQGSTDFVKVKMKNDSEGLGFKKTGDEWLKTTSEFNELLDRLSNDTAEESSDQNQSSLEDRSKKSKARVHYHKFTRGKDLTRYSDKDLASIIGPDTIKQKYGSELNSDYSSNHINRGSLEEYFNKKKNGERPMKTNLIPYDCEMREEQEAPEDSPNTDVSVKSKKKRKKCREKNEEICGIDETCASIDEPNLKNVKKKKKKGVPLKVTNDADPSTLPDCEAVKPSCHKKRKHHEVFEESQESLTASQLEILSPKKSKKLNLETTEPVLDENITTQKKKKKPNKLNGDYSSFNKEHTTSDKNDLLSGKNEVTYEEGSPCNNDQKLKLKKEKKKYKQSLNFENANTLTQDRENIQSATELDAESDQTKILSKQKKKNKSKNKKDAEETLLPSSSNKVIVEGDVKETSSIPQKIDLLTESLLVKHKFETLGISLPEVEVKLNGEEILSKVSATQAAIRKQNLLLHYSVNHWKSILNKKDVNEIKLANSLLIKRRFSFIGLIKEGLEQVESALGSETKTIAFENPDKKNLSQEQRELFHSLLERLDEVKRQSWDYTEELKLKKGEAGIDNKTIDKVNGMFKKPFAPEDKSVFSEIERIIFSNIPAFIETKLKRIKSQVNSVLLGVLPDEFTSNYTRAYYRSAQNRIDTINPNRNQRGRGGFTSRRGQGGHQGSVSFRDRYTNNQSQASFNRSMWNRGGAAAFNYYDRDSAAFHGPPGTAPGDISHFPESHKENVHHGVLNNNCEEEIRSVRITKNKRKKGVILPSAGTHVRFEPLPQDASLPEAPQFGAPISYYRFGQGYRRGEGMFRGLMRDGLRRRGKISQTNYDAKMYAERCKELNKTPEIAFNGVDMSKITGYAAGLTPVKNEATEVS